MSLSHAERYMTIWACKLKEKVIMSMFDYIDELLKESPDDLMKGSSPSGAAAHLHNVNDDVEKLDADTTILLTANLLYLSRQT
jgi:hypothetical protein